MVKSHLCSLPAVSGSLQLPLISVSADLRRHLRIKRVQRASAAHWSSYSSFSRQASAMGLWRLMPLFYANMVR